MQVHKIAIVGAGILGTALASLLQEKGYMLVGMASRGEASLKKAASLLGGNVHTTTAPQEITREADLVFITTSHGHVIIRTPEALEQLAGFVIT